MSLELKDILELARSEAVAYSHWYTSAVASPAFIANCARRWSRQDGEDQDRQSDKAFLTIIVISAVIGATIGSVIPGRAPLRDRFTIAVVVVFAWFAFSVIIDKIIRLLGAKGPTDVTVIAMMQLLALVYVTSNFTALLITSGASVFPLLRLALDDAGLLTSNSVIVTTQVALLLCYLPLTLRAVYGSRGIQAAVAVISAGVIGTVLAGAIGFALLAQSGC